MKYSLRSLMIVAVVAPPLLAVGYFSLKASGLPTPLFLVVVAAIFSFR
jgi:hypothetical protein